MNQAVVRLISGRNSPTFSAGIRDPFADVQETGNQVLRIWNARIEQATQSYFHLRTIILMRNMDDFRFKIFETTTSQFDPADYVWTLNRKRNFEGRSIRNAQHAFTWQPHGSQFTLIRRVSGSARSFSVRKPTTLSQQRLLDSIGYSRDWVTL